MSIRWRKINDTWYELDSGTDIQWDIGVSYQVESWTALCPCKCRFDTREEAQRHAESLLRDELLRLAGELCND